MARPKKYVINLTEDEFKELKSTIRKKKTSKTIRCRCQIILDLDEAHGKVLTHGQSAKSNGVCLATVANTITKYVDGGVDAVTEFKRNTKVNSALCIKHGQFSSVFQFPGKFFIRYISWICRTSTMG